MAKTGGKVDLIMIKQKNEYSQVYKSLNVQQYFVFSSVPTASILPPNLHPFTESKFKPAAIIFSPTMPSYVITVVSRGLGVIKNTAELP